VAAVSAASARYTTNSLGPIATTTVAEAEQILDRSAGLQIYSGSFEMSVLTDRGNARLASFRTP